VWFVEQDCELLVQTELGSGKVKRIRANPVVSAALCNGMGHLRGEQVKGRAEGLVASETGRIEDLVRRKYHWDMLIIGPLRWAQRTFHLGKDRGPTVGLAITPDPAA
jgi:PPOX class probable F420-dependent enzyme